MTNGKTIDEPGSIDPRDPLSTTVIPVVWKHLLLPVAVFYGIERNPAPNALEVMDYTQNRMVTNKDSKGGLMPNCAYNGCCLRKGARVMAYYL